MVVNRFLRGCCVVIPRFIGHSNFSITLFPGYSPEGPLFMVWTFITFVSLIRISSVWSQVWVSGGGNNIINGITNLVCNSILSDIAFQGDEEEAEVQMKGKSSSWKGERITIRSEFKASSFSSSSLP